MNALTFRVFIKALRDHGSISLANRLAREADLLNRIGYAIEELEIQPGDRGKGLPAQIVPATMTQKKR